MKKILIISISCVLALLVIGGIILSHIKMIKKDFNESDYKHIRIKSSWEQIYCENSALVCVETKDGYLEIYNEDLKYLKKIKLPEHINIILYDYDIFITKQDGTVWKYNYETDKDFVQFEGPSDVTEFYPHYNYYLYKDKKGDFYYIYRNKKSKDSQIESINNSNNLSKPQLINNLHNAEILQFGGTLVYTKDGNTYIHYFTIWDEDEIKLFDKDNNVKYHKCIEGIAFTRAIEADTRIYLIDKNKIGYVYKNDMKEIVFVEPVETNLEIKNVLQGFSFNERYDTYILDKNGKFYDDAYKYFIDVKNEPLFKYKRFENIYGDRYIYASDGKYLYKLD